MLAFTVFRCIKLALVHDMAECIVGDIAPSDNVSKAEKHRREEVSLCLHPNTTNPVNASWFFIASPPRPLPQEAMTHLAGLLPEGLKQEIFGLWEVRSCGSVFGACDWIIKLIAL